MIAPKQNNTHPLGHHPPSGRVEQAPSGGTLGEGELPLSKTQLWECSRGKCFRHRQSNPASPSPAIAVSKQQLLTLPKGGCALELAIKFRDAPLKEVTT